MVGRFVFANMYIHRLIFYRAQNERPFHGFDLFFLAFVCAHLGLRCRTQVGNAVVRYWFAILIICGLLWVPGTDRRMDVDTPRDLITRCRVNLLEAIFVVVWMTAGER